MWNYSFGNEKFIKTKLSRSFRFFNHTVIQKIIKKKIKIKMRVIQVFGPALLSWGSARSQDYPHTACSSQLTCGPTVSIGIIPDYVH